MMSPKSMTKLEALTVILELETWLPADPEQRRGGGGVWAIFLDNGIWHIAFYQSNLSTPITYTAHVSSEPVFFNVYGAQESIKEWIPPAYVAWRASTITLFLLGS